MTLKFEQNPTELWHRMTRQGTRRHGKARARGHGMFPTRKYDVAESLAKLADTVWQMLLLVSESLIMDKKVTFGKQCWRVS